MGFKEKKYLVLAVCWLCAITFASLASTVFVEDVDTGFEVSDKFVHAIFYFVNTLLLYLHFKNTTVKYPLLKVSLFSLVYGIIIEVLQYIMPYNRAFEITDIAANTVGILTAIFLIKLMLAVKKR
ncbi:VanZ family protein [Galbibacter sp. EGI 63066]|uniref:VanZ family protein n=1 Tax=Galbibacter sp. EGI 63066 TaxID=2993559 RepID=UPI002248B3FA|nr:VanZ family protein [Galbibacter sp. EGI 63066]MCX2681800.1 VanZ family protein [Galbibacter sp. EGI 63066]